MRKKHQLNLIYPAMLASLMACQAEQSSKQNFVFILVDDLGWADLAVTGSTFYETPNLDELAAKGVLFTNAYAACPVCSPTRASIMSGKYPARLDITDWIPGRQNKPENIKDCILQPQPFNHNMALEEITIAEALKTAGYKTFFAGKWHCSEADEYNPQFQGFDANLGGHHRGSPPGGYFSPYKNPFLTDGPDGEYLTDRLGDESVHFLDTIGKSPFLLYLSFYTVHNPQQGKPDKVAYFEEKAKRLGLDTVPAFDNQPEWGAKMPFKGNFKERVVQSAPVYAAMVSSMDDNVGKVLVKLKETGLDKNTTVIFMADNGGLSTAEGSPTVNGPLRAGKGWLFEGGIREPMIIYYPGAKQNGKICSQPVTSTDFYPTMLELAGLQPIPSQHADGKSIVPLLQGDSVFDRGAIYWHYPHYSNQGGRPGGAVRLGNYKLIEFYEDMHVELYNLDNDISETHDLAGEMPEKTAELTALLHQWRASLNAKMPLVKTEPVN